MTIKKTYKPVDVYSASEVDFIVAKWCRENKFNQVSVNLSRAVREVEAAKQNIDAAFERLETARTNLTKVEAQAREKVEQENGN